MGARATADLRAVNACSCSGVRVSMAFEAFPGSLMAFRGAHSTEACRICDRKNPTKPKKARSCAYDVGTGHCST